jgi:hypothetical protein
MMTKPSTRWAGQAWLALLGFHAAIRILRRLMPAQSWRHGLSQAFLVAVMFLLVMLRCRTQENAAGTVVDAGEHPARR